MESNPENVNTSSSNEEKDFTVEPLRLSEEVVLEEFSNPTVECCGPHNSGRYLEVQDDNFKDKPVKERERCETSPHDLARLCSLSLRRDGNSTNKTGSHDVLASEPSISLSVDQPSSAQSNNYVSSFPSDETSEDTVGSVETPGKIEFGIFSYPEECFLYHEERYKTEKVMEVDHNLPEDHNVQSCLGDSLLNTTLYLDQIKRARNKLKVYDKREILYKANKNKAWINTLPNLSKIKTYMNQQERMLISTNVSFEDDSKQISLDNCLSGIESSISIKEEHTANSAENNMCIEDNNLLQKNYDVQKILSSQKYIKSTALMKLIKNMIGTGKMEISLATNTDKGNHSSQLLLPTKADNLENNPHSSQIKQHLTLVFKCLGCQKYFSDPYKAKRHIISDTCKQEAYLCEHCGATFFSNEYYQRHKSSHLEKYFSFCKTCNKIIFVDTKYLPKKYSENNTGNCPHFSCEVCNKVYHSYASFRNHTRDHKRKSEAKLCEVCGKKTIFFNSHYVKHIKERKFECMICLKTFMTDSHLQSHFMTHTGYRPVNCNICGDEFRSKTHLKRHQLLHTGGYTSKCNYCNYKFLQNSNFRLHLRTFACKPTSNEKPVFSCSHCGREFSKKMYVISHLTSHT